MNNMLDKETTAYGAILIALAVIMYKVLPWVLASLSKNQEFTEKLANASIEQSSESNKAIQMVTSALDEMRLHHTNESSEIRKAFEVLTEQNKVILVKLVSLFEKDKEKDKKDREQH